MNRDKIKQICKIGQSKECCRYLACGGSGFCCLKKVPATKAYLDFRVMNDSITAQGDNCEGENCDD